MRVPDAPTADEPVAEVAEALSGEVALQDMPISVARQLPQVKDYKFVKFDDRILVVNPSNRVVRRDDPALQVAAVKRTLAFVGWAMARSKRGSRPSSRALRAVPTVGLSIRSTPTRSPRMRAPTWRRGRRRTISSSPSSITGTGSARDPDQVHHHAQAGGLIEIALAHIAVDHDAAVLADAGEEGLDLRRRGVLRLVEQDECLLPTTGPRITSNGTSSMSPFLSAISQAAVPIRSLIASRTGAAIRGVYAPSSRGYGRELVLQRARKEPERAPRTARWAG